jgi:hypothetical protein
MDMERNNQIECIQLPLFASFWTINITWFLSIMNLMYYFVFYFLSFSVRVSDSGEENYTSELPDRGATTQTASPTESDAANVVNVDGTPDFKYTKF